MNKYIEDLKDIAEILELIPISESQINNAYSKLLTVISEMEMELYDI